MRAVIVSSAVALLATSPEDDPHLTQTTYQFERLDIDAGTIDLSPEQPSSTLFITLRADDLGPDGVVTTTRPFLDLHAALSGASGGFVTVKGSSPDDQSSFQKTVFTLIDERLPVTFVGNCTQPTQGDPCKARYVLELSLPDGAASDYSVHIDATLSVSSTGTLPAKEDTTVGPLDPPWTIEVSR